MVIEKYEEPSSTVKAWTNALTINYIAVHEVPCVGYCCCVNIKGLYESFRLCINHPIRWV